MPEQQHIDHSLIEREHIAGETLQTRIGGEPMPVRVALEAVCDVLDGLARVHEGGSVHGGVRPANIIFDSEGSARMIDPGDPAVANVDAHSGEPRYLAPEIAAGGPCTASSDIYAVGLVMFEMLTGRHPLSNQDATTAPRTIPAPSALRPGLDAEVDQVVRRALAEQPAQRFASAADMGLAIDAGLRSAPESQKKAVNTLPTVDNLLRKLQRNKDFPAFAGHISEINRLTSANSNATNVDLTNTVLKDYSLTHKLLRLVNSSMYCQFGGKITTVSRAITIIGFKNIRSLAVGLLLFDQVRDSPNARELLEVNLWSFMGAGIARKLAAGASNVDPEQAFISALLARFGTLLAIYYLPDEYAEISRLMREQELDENAASCAVLGLNLHTLGRMIAEHLHFPRLLVETMRAPTDEKPGAPSDASQATQQIAGFAAQLGDIMQRPGDEHRTELIALSQQYQDVIDTDPEQLCELIVDNLHEALDLVEVPKEWLDDIETRLRSLRPPRDDDAGSEAVEQEPGENVDEPRSRSDKLLVGIDEITSMLIAGQALNEVLGAVLEVAYRTLDVQRVVMFINDMRTRQVAARFGIGAIDAALLKKFRFSLSERNELHAAVERGDDVLIENSQAVHDNLPDWYRKHARSATCALLPVRVSDKLIGIVYADADTAHAIDTDQFQHLKTLRNQAALAVSAQRKR